MLEGKCLYIMIGQIYGERKFQNSLYIETYMISKQKNTKKNPHKTGGGKQRDETTYRFPIGSKIFSEPSVKRINN